MSAFTVTFQTCYLTTQASIRYFLSSQKTIPVASPLGILACSVGLPPLPHEHFGWSVGISWLD